KYILSLGLKRKANCLIY
ncbi:ppx/GppA phosphatase family protein, partial [Vibrio parahaemolyticus VPTS-2010_2]